MLLDDVVNAIGDGRDVDRIGYQEIISGDKS